ncbi:TIGR04282 family arsenosugar biosynthesis glycosyltransferase [Maribacter sp. HTCC2170]|uniref:TIGR04282 family arsenosugar biosynthesis glycosyltransferase n=1 Tax=Maribacter sp. (strain HTCC2170 / KCCM 42371) TaxID=313603 RepID=UPI00006AE62B|nr:TIGR04282 family arsenosugar biosynthesis glycosyltransferase [Maribacter sp. HTCC2170]EAR00511.1 hypothetical protein FB2170_08399 [Maribacter sp. HTCC2170]
MSITQSNSPKKDENVIHYQRVNSKDLLLIFTRNPILGACKTRLAAKVGDQVALNIYKFLLKHTSQITNNLNVHKRVYYSEEVWDDDVWSNETFEKCLQNGEDLGQRMSIAFRKGFESGFENIIVIGSDMYDLSKKDLTEAFTQLKTSNFVVGPAEDGGYYLLGMNIYNETVFKNKKWGTNSVFNETMTDLKIEKTHLLKTKNDIDVFDDIKDIKAFQPFLQKL